MSDKVISRNNDKIRKVSTFGEGNSSIESTATSVIVNEVEYSLNVRRRLKFYQQKHPLNLPVKMRMLLCLTYYFKS